ncbi:MAG: DNA replication and repair protein RecF, partial [Phoenicibacter congonensis]|nr:DNA replication and repair protein RecF [Phoenicibacter congonensis]
MRIEGIQLHNFRNFENLELSFDSSRNVLIGENAQGKTNLIEAVYFCGFARSFRTQNSADLIRIGEQRGSVSLDLVSEDISKNITIILDQTGKKMIKKDGKIIRRTADLLNNLVVMVFSPEDLRIIKDSPEKRRNFINKELSQIRPRYYECVRLYREALQQKNFMLRDDQRQGNLNEEMLDIYDMQLAKYGGEIVKYRKNFIQLLSQRANEVQQSITGGKEELQIKYIHSMSVEHPYEDLLARRD